MNLLISCLWVSNAPNFFDLQLICQPDFAALIADAAKHFLYIVNISWMKHRLRQLNVTKMSRALNRVGLTSGTYLVKLSSAHAWVKDTIHLGITIFCKSKPLVDSTLSLLLALILNN